MRGTEKRNFLIPAKTRARSQIPDVPRARSLASPPSPLSLSIIVSHRVPLQDFANRSNIILRHCIEPASELTCLKLSCTVLRCIVPCYIVMYHGRSHGFVALVAISISAVVLQMLEDVYFRVADLHPFP